MNIALWVVQGLFALLFLFVGLTKAFSRGPRSRTIFPGPTTYAPHWCALSDEVELLGGIGLILPVVTHILPWLTVAAAISLALVMICAAIFHASRREFSMIGFSIILLLLAALVVVSRITLAPL